MYTNHEMISLKFFPPTKEVGLQALKNFEIANSYYPYRASFI